MCPKNILTDGLIHPGCAGRHPRPHIGNTNQFKKPLHRSVFTERPVQHREDDIQRARVLDRQGQRTFGRVMLIFYQRVTGGCIQQLPVYIVAGQPFAGFGNANRHDLVFLAIDGIHYPSGGRETDLVLATLSPKNNAYPWFTF